MQNKYGKLVLGLLGAVKNAQADQLAKDLLGALIDVESTQAAPFEAQAEEKQVSAPAAVALNPGQSQVPQSAPAEHVEHVEHVVETAPETNGAQAPTVDPVTVTDSDAKKPDPSSLN
jgi:hypothetical protein